MAYPKWYSEEMAEIEAAKKRLETSKLPLLIFYTIEPLQFSGDGRTMYEHRRIYYLPDLKKIKEDVQFTNNYRPTNTTFPDTVDLIQAFADKPFGQKPTEVAVDIGNEIGAIVERYMSENEISSWEDLGKLLAAYYGIAM